MSIESLLSTLIKATSWFLHELWSVFYKPISSLAAMYADILRGVSKIFRSVVDLGVFLFTPRFKATIPLSPPFRKPIEEAEPIERIIEAPGLQSYISYTINVIKRSRLASKSVVEAIKQPLPTVALSSVLAESKFLTSTFTQAVGRYLVATRLQAPSVKPLEATISPAILPTFKPVIHRVTDRGLAVSKPTLTVLIEETSIGGELQPIRVSFMAEAMKSTSYLTPYLVVTLLTSTYIIEALKRMVPYSAYLVASQAVAPRMVGVFGQLYEAMRPFHLLTYPQLLESFKPPSITTPESLPLEALPPMELLAGVLRVAGVFQALEAPYVSMLFLADLVKAKYVEAFSKAELVERYFTLRALDIVKMEVFKGLMFKGVVGGLELYPVLRDTFQLRLYDMVRNVLVMDMYIVRGEELSPLTTMTVESLRSLRVFRLAEEEARREMLGLGVSIPTLEARLPSSSLATLRPVVHNIFNITVPEDVSLDLRELERRITQILSEQVRRYYGSLTF